MIVLNRESIIEGLIEIRKEEDLENSIIVNNIKSSNPILSNMFFFICKYSLINSLIVYPNLLTIISIFSNTFKHLITI
jgi:hypothetical protein